MIFLFGSTQSGFLVTEQSKRRKHMADRLLLPLGWQNFSSRPFFLLLTVSQCHGRTGDKLPGFFFGVCVCVMV